jgi:hypothetical protein
MSHTSKRLYVQLPCGEEPVVKRFEPPAAIVAEIACHPIWASPHAVLSKVACHPTWASPHAVLSKVACHPTWASPHAEVVNVAEQPAQDTPPAEMATGAGQPIRGAVRAALERVACHPVWASSHPDHEVEADVVFVDARQLPVLLAQLTCRQAEIEDEIAELKRAQAAVDATVAAERAAGGST